MKHDGIRCILLITDAFLAFFPASSFGQVAAAPEGASPDARAIVERALHLEPTAWTALLDEARSTGGLPPDDD